MVLSLTLGFMQSAIDEISEEIKKKKRLMCLIVLQKVWVTDVNT